MSDRLAELRRQRALIHEHLTWLDREIAAAEKTGGSSLAPVPTPLSLSAPLAASLQATAPAWPAPTTPASGQSPLPLRPAEPPLVISAPEPAATPTSRLLPRAFSTVPQPALPSASLGEYRVSPGAVKEDVRKGCLLYFAAAFVLLFVGVGILWMIFRH
jgi:hypothetical protein